MYFDACENLATVHPLLRSSIEQIDNFLSSLKPTAKIDIRRTARFCKIPTSDAEEILELLTETRFLKSALYLECSNCEDLLPVADQAYAWDTDSPLQCPNCNVELAGDTSTEIKQFTLNGVTSAVQILSEQTNPTTMAVAPTRKPTIAPVQEAAHSPSPTDITLLLSGGGYRAAAFHIGVLRWLYEHSPDGESHSFLSKVRRLVGVSGGSFTASHFYCHSKEYSSNFTSPVRALKDFLTSRDMRREVIVNQRSSSDVLGSLFSSKTIDDNSIPAGPALVILATDLSNGDAIAFAKEGISAYETDVHNRTLKQRCTAKLSVNISHAVHASSAFPPFFPPLILDPKLFAGVQIGKALQGLTGHAIVDGGVRDNCGLEYARSQNWAQDSTVLVSDAGLPFDWSDEQLAQQTLGTWGARLLRIVDIQMHRSSTLDYADLPTCSRVSLEGANLSLPSEDPNLSPHYQELPKVVAGIAAKIPTDLIPLSPSQFYALVRLGHQCAKASLSAKWNAIGREVADDNFWISIFPDDARSLTKKEAGQTSLESLLEAQRSRFNGPMDAISHVPKSFRGKAIPFISLFHWWVWLVLLILLISVGLIYRYRQPTGLSTDQSVAHANLTSTSSTTKFC